MKDENRVKYQAELDANRERIKDQLDLEIRTNERLITELDEMSKLQYKKYEEYENEIKKLKEENELLRSGKERVIIIEKRN